ncbi:hypothetical protein [Micromonospora sp. DT227]|uniref:hypothetical protein n=1 Tax=Micromonospora sp. DT227 TaxID=3393433 RepID=UPI003CF483E2
MTTQTGKAPATQRPIKVKPLTWLGRPWRRRAFLHPLFGALVVLALGSGIETARKIGQYPTWGLALATIFIGLLATVAGVLSAAGQKFADVARLYMGATGAVSGIWLTVVAIVQMYGPIPLLIWAGGLVLFTAGYPGMRHAQLLHEARWRAFRTAPTPPPVQVTPAKPVDPDAAKWEALFTSINIKGMRFRERVPTRAGFALHMSLPVNGRVKTRTLANKAEDLEIAAGMPAGSITVEPAVDARGRELAGEVWVYFDVEDILTQTLPMPEDHTELSVNDAFPVGLFADGAPILLKLREIAALIVGVRGRGKTNLLNVIIYQLSRCTDVVLWMIDLKGGRAAKPWLRPWLDGTVKRPVLDWVATTAVEAYRMLTAAKALIEQRSNAGYGGTKVKPTRRRPAVIVICDEVAALVGRHAKPQGRGPKLSDLVALLTSCIQLGRSEAVDFVLATQRATVTMIGGGDLKSQCEMRIGLGVTNPQDAQSVFQGNTVAAKLLTKLKNFATRGAVLVQNGDGGRIAPGKSFFMGDDRDCLDLIYRAATEHALLPAPLDAAGATTIDAAVRALGDGQGYNDRWSEDRAAHLYSDDLDDDWTDEDIDDQLVSAGVPVTPKPAAPAAGTPTASEPDRRARERGGRFFQRTRHRDSDGRREARPDSKPAGRDPYAEEWEAIVAHFDQVTADEVEYKPTEPEVPGKASRYDRMLQIIKEAGEAGIKPGGILARMTREGTAWEERTSIYPALKKAVEDRKIHQPGGPRGVYVYRGDES